MAGAIIENMSTKKLVIMGVTLLLFQAFAFMVGGLIGKGKQAEKGKGSPSASTPSITLADISLLLDEHRAALTADFKSSFESLTSTLDSIHSTITDHGQRIHSLEVNATEVDQCLQQLEDACSALKGDNETLKTKVADLEGRSRRQNLRIIGLPESIEGPRPSAFFSQLLVDTLGAEILASPPELDRAHRSLAPKPAPGGRPRPVILRFHRFQIKDLVIREARRQGELNYKGHKIRLYDDYSPDVAPSSKPALLFPAKLRITLPNAPSPTTAVHYMATKCVDTTKHREESKWFMPWGPNQCDRIRTFEEAMAKKIEANNIVFAVHIPLPNKEMSPWFQFMLVILQFDIAFKMYNQIEDGSLATIDVGLAYRDDTTFENEGRYYECELLPFMEVGSVAHKYYLLNIRLPVNERKKVNVGIGEIKDIRLVSIHQNGGFTKVWFAMKTFLTPSILIIMIWYWRRILMMSRPPVLLEKVILALGISMTFINIPVEWFSVGFNWTWMLLFGDIRQGIFYSMLLSFWIIFCGEHLMDQTERNRFSVYWKQVGPIVGVQLTNPFYSIWASDVGTELAMAFIIVAGICACLYFLFLCFMVFQVFRNISGKRTSLPAMSKARRLHYEVNSAFFTGIYGMWNLYVFAIMFLYAPSHKRYGDEQSSGQCITGDNGGNSGEDIQLTTTITHVDGPTEIYKMTGKEAQE
ncbi:hypothetical protein F7725_011985 [Dissostichus mawsoni]|uniref:Uncharacterized protein n=1 Tax=Dissostichus mawsoni TaxID=36200 RepID=A0A7J5ZAD3_DISMA|nr:hypothetical protein F7725_011985 [Dissostichus mawsoni]